MPGFDASKFRVSCEQSTFCADIRRGGHLRPHSTSFELEPGSLVLDDELSSARATLVDALQNVTAKVVLRATSASVPIWTVQITTARNAFRISPVVLPLVASDQTQPDVKLLGKKDGDATRVLRASNVAWWSELHVRAKPFELHMYVGRAGTSRRSSPAASINSRGLLRFGSCAHGDSHPNQRWGGFADSRPHGCTALAADVFFPEALETFGLPERAEALALPMTMAETVRAGVTPSGDSAEIGPSSGGTSGAPLLSAVREPYRLFNLDVFKYGPGTPVGLYGSLPYVLAHGRDRAAGMLWMNAADTYVDLWRGQGAPGASPTTAQRDTARSPAGVGSHWLSEGGALEIALLGGPSATDVLQQLATLTGAPAHPPLWAMGYHQSHWNVRSQGQVAMLDRNFDRHGVPLDCVWLDIEHTQGKRYFTFDRASFPSPEALHAQLAPKGRRIVGIADPHLKADPKYAIHARALAKGWLVRDASGKPFVGECWPGASSYLDLLQPEARKFWASLYALGPSPADVGAATIDAGASTSNLGWPLWMHSWNDMNEPSVFDSAELTLPRDATHEMPPQVEAAADDGAHEAESRGNSKAAATSRVEHRLIHNAYGALQASSTYEGMLARTASTERPFLLSRAFFIGSQRFGAVWTGDNSASWEHLRLSFSMVLTLSLSGMPFAGADVGGFFGDPSPELLTRWYQAGAYLPFYRGHAHLDAARREPFLLPRPYSAVAAEAVRERQRLLPYWSTLWWAAAELPAEAGIPIVAPPWLRLQRIPSSAWDTDVDVETVSAALRVDGQWMLGDALLVQPVSEPATSTVLVSLPGGNATLWYDVAGGGAPIEGGRAVKVAAPLHAIPRFQRGGSIIPRRERVRRSALLSRWDPITLHVAPNHSASARGRLYLDDGLSTSQHAKRPAALFSFGFECVGESAHIDGDVSARSDSTMDSFARCQLNASAEEWGSNAPVEVLPVQVSVETILIRGVALSPTERWVATLLTKEAQTNIHVEVVDGQGVRLTRMDAPLHHASLPWTVFLSRQSQSVGVEKWHLF